jgi:predicted metal-binding protein
MTQHIFFICQSCQLTSANNEESEPAGTILLKELQAQHQNWSRKSEFEIRGVGCLCTCDHPCVFALAGMNKPTYLFADLPAQEIAPAILTLGEFYADRDNGLVPNYKLPEVLQVARLARIPPWPNFDMGAS